MCKFRRCRAETRRKHKEEEDTARANIDRTNILVVYIDAILTPCSMNYSGKSRFYHGEEKVGRHGHTAVHGISAFQTSQLQPGCLRRVVRQSACASAVLQLREPEYFIAVFHCSLCVGRGQDARTYPFPVRLCCPRFYEHSRKKNRCQYPFETE